MSSTSSGVRFLNPIRDMHDKDIEEEQQPRYTRKYEQYDQGIITGCGCNDK
jgi:hypothetical protein